MLFLEVMIFGLESEYFMVVYGYIGLDMMYESKIKLL